MRFATIQGWLRESPPITESSPPVSALVPFGELWAPIAEGATAALASRLRTQLEPSVLDDLRTQLISKLAEIGEGIIWEHFNTRRTLSELVAAHLAADEHGPRRAMYCRVLDDVRADGLRALEREYPILGEYLSAAVTNWLIVAAELVTRVSDDRVAIAEAFGLSTDVRLVGVRADISDVHRGGRTVAVLTFASPTDAGPVTRKLVYKPRDMRVDSAYHQLISRLNASVTDLPPLQHLTVLCRSGYGYEEYVEHQVCSNTAELQRFYYNAGRLTAILYVLGCNDCHHENVIAHGDQLVLVDAETVLQGTPRRVIASEGASARETLDARLADSVLRIGTLPHWFFVEGEREARDVSALGIAPPVTETVTHYGWQALNTDGMVAGEVLRPARLSEASPVPIGVPNRLVDFGEDVCAGFLAQLDRVADRQQSWLGGEDGFLAPFENLRSRFVRRPTWTYQWLLDQLRSPPAMGGSDARQRALSQLGKPHRPGPGDEDDAILAAERAQLHQLDVPYFEQNLSGTDLVIGDMPVATGFFAYSGLDSARRRIESLDAEQIQLQLTVVKGLLSAKFRRAHRRQRRQSTRNVAAVAPSTDLRCQAAFAAGDMLLDGCVADAGGTMEWLGIDSTPDLERCCYGPLGPSLYSGRAGIAVFLATLGDFHPDRARAAAYRAAATAALSDLLRILTIPNTFGDRESWWRDQPLGLAGSGGQLLAALSLSPRLPEVRVALRTGLESLLDALDPDHLAADEDTDIIFGCAGLIGPLLMMRNPTATQLAAVAGNRIAERQSGDGGWVVPSISDVALTGFSHGASGRAAALAKLAAVTGDRRSCEAAVQAVKFERAQLDSCEGNWPDQRDSAVGTAPTFMLSWCHGAPGIALARLCMRPTPLWDAAIEDDLMTALHATTASLPLGDSLCCGRLGRAAILRIADRREETPRWLSSGVTLEAAALAGIRAEWGFDFGDVQGLFQGAAGLGLALLDGIPGARTVSPMMLSAGLIE